jgi:hypothetical protein
LLRGVLWLRGDVLLRGGYANSLVTGLPSPIACLQPLVRNR